MNRGGHARSPIEDQRANNEISTERRKFSGALGRKGRNSELAGRKAVRKLWGAF